jgi:hypothetical protein
MLRLYGVVLTELQRYLLLRVGWCGGNARENIGSKVGQVTGYSDRDIRGSPEFLKANAGKGPRLDHDRFIQNYFQFISCLTIRRQTVQTLKML